MRFALFGGADCSDLLLAQLAALSALPEDAAAAAAEIAMDTVERGVAATGGDDEDAAAFPNLVAEFANRFGAEMPTAAAALCAAHHVVTSAVRFDVATRAAAAELELLGLSKAAAVGLLRDLDTTVTSEHSPAVALLIAVAPSAAQGGPLSGASAPRPRRQVLSTALRLQTPILGGGPGAIYSAAAATAAVEDEIELLDARGEPQVGADKAAEERARAVSLAAHRATVPSCHAAAVVSATRLVAVDQDAAAAAGVDDTEIHLTLPAAAPAGAPVTVALAVPKARALLAELVAAREALR